MAIVERKAGILQVRKRRRRRIRCCYYDSPSLPLYSDYLSFARCVYYIAICCSASTGSVQLLGLETGRETTVGVQLQLPSRQLLQELLQVYVGDPLQHDNYTKEGKGH